MHFTAERRRLIDRITLLRRNKYNPRRVFLYACAARVFVQFGNDVAGEEALVFQDGGVNVSTRQLLNLLCSFPSKKSITVLADKHRLHIGDESISVSAYIPQPAPPAEFVIGRVTDTWLARPSD